MFGKMLLVINDVMVGWTNVVLMGVDIDGDICLLAILPSVFMIGIVV